MNELIITEKSSLVAVADAIRAKTNTSAEMSLYDMPNKVLGISAGGGYKHL